MSWRRNGSVPLRPARSARELEFLPAALEVLATPPPLASRVLMLLIAGVSVAVIMWAAYGRLDQVVVAPGTLVPGGHVKVIQPFERGTVQAVHVREGQRVQADQLLLELDATQAAADVQRIRQALVLRRLELARLTVFADHLRQGPAASLRASLAEMVGEMPSATQVGRAQEHLRQALAAHQAKVSELGAHLRRARAELATGESALARTGALLPILAEREATFATLVARGAAARAEWLGARERLVGAQYDQRIQARRVHEARASIAASVERQRGLLASTRSDTAARVAQLRQEVAATRLALAKARQREARHALRTPVAGTVTALTVHTVGAVVTPAERLMQVVPDGVPLRVEALVANKDVGFVRPGQFVEIKVDSFPFTRFGLLSGRVSRVSADAVHDPVHGAVFKLEAMLAQHHMQVGARTVRLSPGMSVVTEVKTGTRTVLEFLLDPALRAASEALRER